MNELEILQRLKVAYDTMTPEFDGVRSSGRIEYAHARHTSIKNKHEWRAFLGEGQGSGETPVEAIKNLCVSLRASMISRLGTEFSYVKKPTSEQMERVAAFLSAVGDVYTELGGDWSEISVG